jgi:hypothetical protein
MKEQIEKMEAQIRELKEVYENEQKAMYESRTHKHFEKGDIVTNGDTIVIVEWNENKIIGCEYEKGYFGGSIINNHRGFGTFKRDEFDLVVDEYYKKEHQISLVLTGLEIEELKYTLGYRNLNYNETKSKILDYLDTIR